MEMKKDQKLFIFLKNNTTISFKKYSDIFEGEYYNYYYNNAKNNILKFTIIFFFELFFELKYKFEISNKSINNVNNWIFIKTSEYIFNDNLLPIINSINNVQINYAITNLSKFRNFNFFNFLKFNVFKKYFSFHLLKNLSLKDWIIGLYIELIVIPKVEKILACIDDFNTFNNSLFLSADPADLFPRAINHFTNKGTNKFILIQNSPVESDTPEWKSVKSDLVISWEEFNNFFNNNGINSLPFFPPRFYYTKRESDYKKDLDLVIFMPWLRKDKNGKKILKEIRRIMIECEKSCENLIYIKYHPAGELDLKLSKKFVKINSQKSAKKVLMCSKKILNFGSTVSFDCKYLNVCCGIVNISNHLPKDSSYLSLKHATLISSLDDLKMFLQLETFVPGYKKFDNNDLISYLLNLTDEKRK